MKKKLLAMICLIMAVLMSFACLGGCNLITTDSEKDVKQVVATVSIEEGLESTMYKQDLLMDYVSYGYQYVQYSGKTMEETIKILIDARVETMILSQSAMKYLEENNLVENNSQPKWNTARYLTAEEEIDAKYTVYKGINDMLSSFEKEEDSSKSNDSTTETARTAPTNATPYEEEITTAKKQEYIAKGFDTKSTVEKREAFNKFINFLKINSLLGSDYVAGKIETTAYFKDNLKNSRENEILSKFETLKKNEYLLKHADEDGHDNHNLADVEILFKEKVEEQKEWDNKTFVEKLENASASAPILYSKYGTYGYVYNLLLGADSTQTDLINKIDSKLSDQEKAVERAKILSTTRIKDLRNSWITAGYDFDFTPNVEGGKVGTATFTHDYALATKSLPFQGEVTLLKKASTEDEDDKYTATSKVFGLDEFLTCMHNYMLDGNFVNTLVADGKITNQKNDYDTNGALEASVYGAGKYNQDISEYDKKINELLFAFSTDPGSLNTYKGYTIKPKVDVGNETYVETFTDAARVLLSKGGQSYVIVASEHGYHVMFFSQIFKADTGYLYQDGGQPSLLKFLENFDLGEYATWEDYYTAMMDDFFEWEDTENYLYVLQNANVSSRVTSDFNKYTSSLVAKYRYEKTDCVTINEKAYQDLLD